MAQRTRKNHKLRKVLTTQENNRLYDLCNDSVKNEVKKFYDKTFKDNLIAYNNAKANLSETTCFAPNCKCIRRRVTKYKRVKQNNESFLETVEVEPPKLYVFCHACASVFRPSPSWC